MGNLCSCFLDPAEREGKNDVELEKELLELEELVTCDNFQSPTEGTVFKKSDSIEVLEKINDEWYKIRNKRTGKEGTVPKSFVVPVNSLLNKPWYFPNVTRLQVETRLLTENEPDGSFLIRNPCTAHDCKYVLSVKYTRSDGKRSIAHFKIKISETLKYYLDQQAEFESLDNLIEYYKANTHDEDLILTNPCPKVKTPHQYDLHPIYVKSREIAQKDIILLNKIGCGNFGDVYHGKFRYMKDVAVKVLRSESDDGLDEYMREVAVMKLFRHENIVALYGVCSKCKPIYIIQEFVPNGSLLSHVRSFDQDLDSSICIIIQVINAMCYIEKLNVVHRDLAARNVLLGDNLQVKICDFGLSRLLKEGAYKISNTTEIRMPIKWTAPEAFTQGKFSSKSDVWSFGVLLFEIFSQGEMPFKDISNRQLLRVLIDGTRLPRPNKMPENVYKTACDCWEWDPENRPNFGELKTYFKEYEKDSFN